MTAYPATKPRGRESINEIHPSRWNRAWLLVPVVLVFLVALAVLEVYWIPESMPREYVGRATLIIFPTSASESNEWTEDLEGQTKDPRLVQAVIARLDLGGSESGASLSPDQLAKRVHVRTQCVQVPEASGAVREGRFLVVTARGKDQEELDRIVKAWSRAFSAAAQSSEAPLEVSTPERIGLPYQVCMEE
ncbi:MAG: hypothetical protein HY684_01950 [Chloroflexi bacterium]|nr:hypothetical protein [Chloroflexota bacterium]